MSLNTLLISDEIIKERTVVHGNIDPKLIYPDIKVAQDFYILPIVGTALFDVLQARVDAGVWTNYTDYKTLLDKYIIDALIYHTLAELPTTLSYQFWNKGMQRKTGDNTENPSMEELLDISNKYRTRGEMYCNKLKNFLIAESSLGKYPEYLQPGTRIDTIVPNRNSFTLPIYLDEDKCNPYCNPGGFTGQPYHD